MKKFLLLFALSICSFLHSQTITTYYIIPPVSGCDGVWAIDANQVLCGQTYIFTPTLCASFSGQVADTMYLALCSQPCSLMVMGPNGPCGFCGTPLTTGQQEAPSPVFTTYPNPATAQSGYTIVTSGPAQEVKAEIISLAGQTVATFTESALTGKVVLDTSQLATGTYLVRIAVDNAPPVLQKMVLL
ncbi:MAG: T9SS type A sorting domain-containing protein [Bacteroidetes bacterium]|nr:T9SS type A sorting domain-containing protein [Bacteroidota bacterium]